MYGDKYTNLKDTFNSYEREWFVLQLFVVLTLAVLFIFVISPEKFSVLIVVIPAIMSTLTKIEELIEKALIIKNRIAKSDQIN